MEVLWIMTQDGLLDISRKIQLSLFFSRLNFIAPGLCAHHIKVNDVRASQQSDPKICFYVIFNSFAKKSSYVGKVIMTDVVSQ